MSNYKPTVIVFDLDYTLWPFWVDTHVTPPFKKKSDSKIVDQFGQTIKYYPDVPEVLADLHNKGYILAVASRTGEIKGAHQLLGLLGWEKYFHQKEIYPGCKVQHLTNIKKKVGIEFHDMVFFDDEHRNIRDTSELGVHAVLVRNGVSKNVVEDALGRYAGKKSISITKLVL